MLENVILTNWFLKDIRTFKPKFTYLKLLESTINSTRIRSEALVNFFATTQILLTKFHKENPALVEELEESLVLAGKVPSAYKPVIKNLQKTILQMTSDLYRTREDNELHKNIEKINADQQQSSNDLFLLSLISQSSRFADKSKIDSLLLQNISTKELKSCQRCSLISQLAIEIDECITEFQANPCWLNTYISTCYCGGQWTGKAPVTVDT